MSATLRRIEAAQIARAMTAAHESTSERRDPSVGDWRARAAISAFNPLAVAGGITP